MAGPTILHVDLDAFFVAVEVADDPSLAGRPVVVGGTGTRGVVAAASYEARYHGIHSAMPTARARRLCPDAVFIPGRHDRYREASAAFHAVLQTFTPLVEGIALDEAFLDVGGAARLLGDGPAIAWALRARVADDLGLSCSVGVAPRKLTAKLASESAKPRPSARGPVAGSGVVVVGADDEIAFLHRHPVASLWGVGPATQQRLAGLGVTPVGQLAALPVEVGIRTLGEAAGRRLHDLAWARDERPVEPQRQAKSVGHEETFAVDVHQRPVLEGHTARLADAVAARLRRAGLAGRCVQLKVRFGDFRTITRSHTVTDPIDTGPAVAGAARQLLDGVDIGSGVRLLGVSVSLLGPPPARQLRLDDDPSWREVTDAIDEIRVRYGDDAIAPGAALGAGGVRTRRAGDHQWGPEADHRQGPDRVVGARGEWDDRR